jgi:hypothetical protein
MGFVHLNGGFEGGRKGYNPDDLGEWIMVRMSPAMQHRMRAAEAAGGSSSSSSTITTTTTTGTTTTTTTTTSTSTSTSTVVFDSAALYGPPKPGDAPSLCWEPFERRHFAQVSSGWWLAGLHGGRCAVGGWGAGVQWPFICLVLRATGSEQIPSPA